MHLQNVTPRMTVAEKDFRVRIWYSILSLERVLAVMTGRPSMVHDKDCSVPLPSLDYHDPLLAGVGYRDESQDLSSMGYGTRILAPASIAPMTKDFIKRPRLLTNPPISIVYFRYFAELNALAQDVLFQLYNPNIRHLKWSEIHRRILELDDGAIQWASVLPKVLDILVPSLDTRNEPYRIAIAILLNSVRMIINRPCLCRLDRKISNQSSKSAEASRESASKCVHLARAILTYLPNEPDLKKNHSGPLWWMLHHHLKRATTVLLLELAYRSVHMPSEWEEILVDAKKGVTWLRALATYSVATKNSWVKLSRLLQLAAQKVGGDASDIVTHFDQTQAPPLDQYGPPAAEPYYSMYDPAATGAWNPFDFSEGDVYNQQQFIGDLTTSELDQFGFLRGPEFPSVPARAGETANMPDEADDKTGQRYGFYGSGR